MDYWNRLKADTDAAGGKGKQASPLRTADAGGPAKIALEDGSGTVDLWFSPNTPHSRAKDHADEATPPDLNEVFSLIANAKQAILFVAFEPGEPSIIEAIAKAQTANPKLFVRGTVTVAKAANDFAVAIRSDAATGDGGSAAVPSGQGDLQDYRVIPAEGIKDPVSVWEKELNSAGFAVTHSKLIVIDPFADDCVVVTGSHNLGFQASYNNDENMAVIKGHRALAQAYAANALDIYDHYAWRWWLAKNPDGAWTSLKTDDTWQQSYFDATGQAISAELRFWLGASSSLSPSSDRAQPAIAEIRNRRIGVPPPANAVRPVRTKNVSHATGLPHGAHEGEQSHG
jgi:phosphatidylserine/phosphatidylglycerophosphate/cardiolipin synthase-like enzyme